MTGERSFNSGGGPDGTGLTAPPTEHRPWWATVVAVIVLLCGLAIMIAGAAATVWAVFG